MTEKKSLTYFEKMHIKVKRDFYNTLDRRKIDWSEALKHALMIAHDFIEENQDPLTGWNEVIGVCEAAKKKHLKKGE